MKNQPRGLSAVLTAVAVIGAASCGLRDGDSPFDPPEEPVLWMYAQAPIAVGARLELVAYLSCPKSVGNSEGSACEKTGIASVTSVSLDDPAGLSPGEVRLEPLSSSSDDLFAAYIPVTASAPADTTLRVTVKDTRGQTLSTEVPVSARVANRVTLSPRCDNPTASAPYLIGKGKIVWFDYGLFDGDVRLATGNFLPLSTGSLAVWSTSSSVAVLRMPDSGGTTTLTSPLDPSLSLAVQVFDPSTQVSGLTLQRAKDTPEGPYPVTFPESEVELQVFATVQGRAVCSGGPDVTLDIVDRHVCSFFPLSQDGDGIRTHYPRGADFSVHGWNEGTCAIHAVRSTAQHSPGATMTLEFVTDLPRGPGRFVWEAPLPQGNDLRAVSGTRATDVWAIGWAGTILHYDGTGWRPVDSGLDQGTKSWPKPSLRHLWAAAAKDIFAVGERGLILRWNGSAWKRMESGTTADLFAVMGSSASDVWAVGWGGVILHFDGLSWSQVTSGTTQALTSVWVESATRAFILGYDGTALVFNGASWSPDTALPGTANLFALHGGAGELWGAGTGGGLWRRTGAGWSFIPSGSSEVFHTVFVAGANDVWASGLRSGVYHWNGTSLEPVARASTNAILSIWGSAPNDLWGVGHAGLIEHYDGTTWTRLSSEPTMREDLRGMWRAPNGDLWAAFAESVAGGVPGEAPAGTLLRRRDGVWEAIPVGTNARFNAVWGTSDSDIWAVGGAGTIVHFDGTSWSRVPSNTTSSLSGIWGSSPANIWVSASNATVLHWNGKQWSADQLENWVGAGNPDYNAVWGASANDVWIVGTGNGYQPWTLWHFNGLWWSKQAPALRYGSHLTAIWGSSRTNVWAVGTKGEVIRYDGSKWTRVRTGLDRDLTGVWGSGDGSVWVTGNFDVLRWKDGVFQTIPPATYVLNGVYASGSDVWIYGFDGTLLKYLP